MKFGNLNFRALGGVAALGAIMLSGCDAATSVSDGQEVTAATLDPILAAPAVGDLWAAKLDEFSDYEFGQDGDEMGAAYGLLKVTQVEAASVTVITESGAWPSPEGTLGELQGDLSGIVWDESESISIDRADLPGLVEQGHILETRRLSE